MDDADTTAAPAAERTITLGDRLRYRFDNAISRGTGVVILWMLVIVLALAILAGLVVAARSTTVRANEGTGKPSMLDESPAARSSTLRHRTPGGACRRRCGTLTTTRPAGSWENPRSRPADS